MNERTENPKAKDQTQSPQFTTQLVKPGNQISEQECRVWVELLMKLLNVRNPNP